MAALEENMEKQKLYEAMRILAANIRIETLYAMASFGGGHVGGCMSIADTLAVLYGGILRYDCKCPDWEGRDRLVMSKGHCGPALYAALSLSGFFPREWLSTLNQPGTRLPSHCDRLKTPGIDASTGSLGQGVSLACGMALAGDMKGQDFMVYAILGDGELQEGQVWEALLFASHRNLGRLVFLIDRNRMQLDGRTEDISGLEPLDEKLMAFGFHVVQTDGHQVGQIEEKLRDIRENPGTKPHVVILHTKKGAGYFPAERAELCHYMQVTRAEAEEGAREIRRRLNKNLPVSGVQND